MTSPRPEPRPPASAPPGPSRAFFDALRAGGRCTQVVAAHRAWDPQDPSLRATREAARRGLRIERSFLLAHRFQRDDPRLVAQQKLDHEAGIATRLLHAGPHVAALGELAPDGFELGLWDDAVCGTFVSGKGADAGRIVAWRESRAPEQIERARRFFTELDARVAPADAEPADALPEEPVVACVPIAQDLARGCRVDPDTGQSCAGFHGAAAYWRAFGLLGGTFCDRALYERGLAPLFSGGAAPRILISGTADYSLFALLLWIARRAGVEPEVTVSDLCPTPLGVVRWYAERERARVRTVVADALAFASAEPFDAICTNYFLGWIPAERRGALIHNWARLLRPGGRLVTNFSVRVGARPAAREGPRADRFAPGQLDTFRTLAVARARAFQDWVGLDAATAAALAEDYLPRWRSRFAPTHVSDLPGWFEDAGFELACELREPTPRLRPDWNPAPELEALRLGRKDRREAWVVAVRR